MSTVKGGVSFGILLFSFPFGCKLAKAETLCNLHLKELCSGDYRAKLLLSFLFSRKYSHHHTLVTLAVWRTWPCSSK